MEIRFSKASKQTIIADIFEKKNRYEMSDFSKSNPFNCDSGELKILHAHRDKMCLLYTIYY